MSRLYDTIEPTVITKDMLEETVYEFGPKGEAGNIAKVEGLPFEKVHELKLSFKNILEIDNLSWFKLLTKLQLDNNIIEKIENLSHLVNLKWLDVSFNNITKIEGLETLTKLEDLTIFHNRIGKIENIEKLTQLQVLSIGSNLLQDLGDIKYLRQLKSLKALNIKGNPFCDDEKFRVTTLAYLPNLVYLDYKRIDENEKKDAYMQMQIQMDAVLSVEAEKESELEVERDKKEKEALYALAFVDGLDQDQLFDSIFEDDPDGDLLRKLPKVKEHSIEYKSKFSKPCLTLFQYGLDEYENRKVEIDDFLDCLNEAKSTNKTVCVNLINDFLKFKNKTFNALAEGEEEEQLRLEYKKKTAELQKVLMSYELQLVDQIEDAINVFERDMGEVVKKFKSTVESELGKYRELDISYQSLVAEEASAYLEKLNKNDPMDNLIDELSSILSDKDSMTNALEASKDAHLVKIDGKIDDINNRIGEWFTKFIDNLRTKEEVERNRARVLEICLLIDNFNWELDNIDNQLA